METKIFFFEFLFYWWFLKIAFIGAELEEKDILMWWSRENVTAVISRKNF